MNINDLVDILLKIREKHGNLPVWIPYNYGNDDYKVCTRAIQQDLYTGPFKAIGEMSVVLKNHNEDINDDSSNFMGEDC